MPIQVAKLQCQSRVQEMQSCLHFTPKKLPSLPCHLFFFFLQLLVMAIYWALTALTEFVLQLVTPAVAPPPFPAC